MFTTIHRMCTAVYARDVYHCTHTHTQTHSLTRSLTHPRTQARTHRLTRSASQPASQPPTHPPTPTPTHPPTHPPTPSPHLTSAHLTDSLTHSLTHARTHPRTHALTHMSITIEHGNAWLCQFYRVYRDQWAVYNIDGFKIKAECLHKERNRNGMVGMAMVPSFPKKELHN